MTHFFWHFIRWDQVNLLVHGPKTTKTKKYYKILANWLFLIYYVLLFEKNKKHNQLQNQEAFIVFIINYKLRVFLAFAMQNIILSPKNQVFLFCRPTEIKKLTWFHLLYLIQTLRVMWRSPLREKFNFYFSEIFVNIDKILILGLRLNVSL